MDNVIGSLGASLDADALARWLSHHAHRIDNVNSLLQLALTDETVPGLREAAKKHADGRRLMVADSSTDAAPDAVRTFVGHRSGWGRAWFAGQHQVITAGCDGYVCVWDLDSGQRLRRDEIGQVVASCDTRAIAIGTDKQVALWDVPAGRMHRTLPVLNARGAVLSDRWVAARDGDHVTVWDADTGAEQVVCQAQGWPALAGTTLLIAGQRVTPVDISSGMARPSLECGQVDAICAAGPHALIVTATRGCSRNPSIHRMYRYLQGSLVP
jgi:hypothetical protein